MSWRDPRWPRIGGAAFSAALIVLLAAKMDVSQMGDALALATPPALVGSAACALAGASLMAFGWMALLHAQGFAVSPARAWWLHMVGLFFASFTPGGVGGDFLRYLYLSRTNGKRGDAVLSIVALRAISLTSLTGVAVMSGLVAANTGWMWIGPAVLAGGGLIVVWAARRDPGDTIVASHQPTEPGVAASRGWRVLQPVRVLIHDPRRLAAAVALVGLGQLVAVSSSLPLATVLPIPTGPVAVLATVSLARLAALLPISLLGVGVYEVAVGMALEPHGVQFEAGVSLAVLDHMANLIVTVLGGLLYLAHHMAAWRRTPANQASGGESDR